MGASATASASGSPSKISASAGAGYDESTIRNVSRQAMKVLATLSDLRLLNMAASRGASGPGHGAFGEMLALRQHKREAPPA